MSGGHFDYEQHRITGVAEEVELLIRSNDDDSLDEWNQKRGRFYQEEVIDEFKKGLDLLRKAAIYTQRIDWLVSDDDGRESFIERLEEDLKEYDARKRERRPDPG